MEHTPGPWMLCYDGQIDGPDGRRVCCGMGFNSYKEFNENDRAKSNARLIASAPELLKACKHLVQILDLEGEEFYNSHIETFNMGIDAINKAEGK